MWKTKSKILRFDPCLYNLHYVCLHMGRQEEKKNRKGGIRGKREKENVSRRKYFSTCLVCTRKREENK